MISSKTVLPCLLDAGREKRETTEMPTMTTMSTGSDAMMI